MRHKFFVLIAASVFSGTTYAQTESDMRIESVPDLKKTTIELYPISGLVSQVPGVGAIAGSLESYLGDKVAGFVELGYADVDLGTDLVEKADDETSEPIARKGYGYATAVGIRYYEDIIGSSFYGSGSVAYSEAKATWLYDDHEIKSELYTVTPSVTAGYRWVWRNGILIRAGIGAGMPTNVGSNINRSNEGGSVEDGRKKIDDIQTREVIAKADFGLGYTF
jgi:hypothetical protein